MARTKEEIQREYASACAELGQLEYQIDTLGDNRQKMLNAIRNLNIEANKLREQEEKLGTPVDLPVEASNEPAAG